MDSFTQIVLGAAVANAVAGKKLKNRAIAYGAVLGTIPDLDVVVGWFLDPLTALEIHRGMSHSVFFAIVLAPILGYVIFRWERRRDLSFSAAFWMVFLGLFTHALLDMFTTWGTRIFWPINYPIAFKSVFVIDPIYTIPFALCVLIAMREKKDLDRRIRWNTIGLIVSSAYLLVALGIKWFVHQRFVERLQEEEISYSRISVKPTALNTILWNAIVETPETYWIGDYSLFDQSSITFRSFEKKRYLGTPYQDTDLFQRLIRLSEGWYTLSEREGMLFFNDLRFGLLKEEEQEVQFAFSYVLTEDEQGSLQVTEAKKDKRDGIQLLKNLWVRLKGR